jgi:DNA-binding PadR family transcriptional regulator
VLLDKPMHGYEVRRELEQWQAERWATIAYGSLYFGLKKMADEGLLDVVDAGEGRGRTVYAITEAGRVEFHRLLAEHWWRSPGAKDPFVAALTFMDRLDRGDLLAALHHRAAALRASVQVYRHLVDVKEKYAGRHIAEIMRLGAAREEAELTWVEEVIGKVERHELP